MEFEIATTGKETKKSYAFSTIGIIHAVALVSSLVAFICNESAPWCEGKSFCSVPIYASTYTYYSAMTLTAFLSSGILYILHCTAVFEKLPCTSIRKLIGELACVGGIVFFLVFGNLFMISRTGNRVIYMISTFFGCLAMAMFGIQLVLVLMQNCSQLTNERCNPDSTTDVESNDPECPVEESPIHMTKHINIDGGSWKNSPSVKGSNQASPNMHVVNHNSVMSSSEEDSDFD